MYPADIVPANRYGWTEAVIWQGEIKAEVVFEQTLGELSECIIIVSFCALLAGYWRSYSSLLYDFGIVKVYPAILFGTLGYCCKVGIVLSEYIEVDVSGVVVCLDLLAWGLYGYAVVFDGAGHLLACYQGFG